MYESKYSKLLTGLLIAGIIIIILVFAFLTFRFIKNGKIMVDADEGSEHFKGNSIYNGDGLKNEMQGEENVEVNEVAPEIGVGNIIDDGNSNTTPDSDENTDKYKGFNQIGTIEIPAINLNCPVLEDASKDALEVAVGKYDGPGLNKVGNTTIAGHNYRNGTFFSNNKKLVNGDKIYITDSTRKKVAYSIYYIYTTTPEDSTYLERDTKGKREISLTTCTDDSKSRLIIFAKEDA